jgi:hypothetical protein
MNLTWAALEALVALYSCFLCLTLFFFLFAGEGCVDKPLSTLWRNHVESDKPDIVMKVRTTV